MESLIHCPLPFLFQTVASLRVSDRLPRFLSVSLEPEHGEAPGAWGGGKSQRRLLTVAVCSPFPPTVSYQQGVLSATILYEILLGKAALYAALVGVLVLMAMVRRRAGWGQRATGVT